MTSAVKAQHSKVSVEWGTPHAIVELAREVMGGIDCDPCSSAYWNEHVVKADTFFGLGHPPGLDVLQIQGFSHSKRWLINPPGGMVKEFWRFALDRWQAGSAVLWVGFNLNQMTYLARRGLFSPAMRRLMFDKRIRYLRRPTRGNGPPTPGDAPPHGSYLVFMPGNSGQCDRFEALAPAFGVVF